MGIFCISVFREFFSISCLSGLYYEKCLNDPIVESVTPLFPFEGKNLVSQYLLELPKKEEMQWFIEGQIRGEV